MPEGVEVLTSEGRSVIAEVSRFRGFPDEGICGFRDEWQPGLLHAVSFHDSEPHSHDDMEEIFLVLQGTGRIILGTVEIPVSKWDTVKVPRKVIHRGLPDPGQDLVVAVIFIKTPPAPDPEGASSKRM